MGTYENCDVSRPGRNGNRSDIYQNEMGQSTPVICMKGTQSRTSGGDPVMHSGRYRSPRKPSSRSIRSPVTDLPRTDSSEMSFLRPVRFTEPIARLMQITARSEPVAERKDELRNLLMSETVEWESVFERSVRHGTTALLVHHIHEHRLADAVPEPWMSQLRGYAHAILRHNVCAVGELRRVVTALDDAGIASLPIKGPLLAKRYYRNVALRRFVDLDLVVERSQVLTAMSELSRLGYEPGYDRSAVDLQRAIDAHLGIEMVHPERGMVVEVHWALLNRTYDVDLGIEDVWKRADTMAVGTSQVSFMTTEDVLLYLCVHGAKHHWAALKWACDVAELLRASPSMDWGVVMQRAEAARCTRLLLLGVGIAHRWLAAPVPDPVLDAARQDSCVESLIRQIETGWLFSKDPLERTPSFRKFWFTVRTRRHLRDSARHVWHHAKLVVQPTEKDRAWIDLPSSVTAAYPLIRPIRIFWQWAGLGSTSSLESSLGSSNPVKPDGEGDRSPLTETPLASRSGDATPRQRVVHPSTSELLSPVESETNS